MGEGTSEIRHLRERVILHDEMLRAMGERIRLLDEMVHRLEALLPRGAVADTNGGVAPSAPLACGEMAARGGAGAAATAAEARRAPVVRRR